MEPNKTGHGRHRPYGIREGNGISARKVRTAEVDQADSNSPQTCPSRRALPERKAKTEKRREEKDMVEAAGVEPFEGIDNK